MSSAPPAVRFRRSYLEGQARRALRSPAVRALALLLWLASAAVSTVLQVLQADRSFGDELGRHTLLRLFAVLGKGDELAGRYRRKMFNFLH